MKQHIAIFAVFLFFITAASVSGQNHHKEGKKGRDQYREAVIDAMVAEESEICSTLIAIKPDETYLNWSGGRVLVVTWTKKDIPFSAGDTITTSWGYTWVTVVPELKDWYKKHRVKKINISTRIKQLLGLPATSNKNAFVEMWVKPSDLFRPAYNSKIDDHASGIRFPANASPEYIAWFDSTIILSYYPPNSTLTFPWTRLGYTYDWGNPKSKIGLSEFVVRKYSRVIIKSVSPTETYLQ
jgi:hypothetical protein